LAQSVQFTYVKRKCNEGLRRVLWKMKKIDEEEVWSAIRYLDPDEREKDKGAKTATILAILALLPIIGSVWVLLWLRLRQP